MNDRDRRALRIGLLVVAAALLWRFAAWPAMQHWRDARAAVAAYDQQLTSLEQRLADRDAAASRLRQRYGDAIEKPLLSLDETRVLFPQAVQEALRQSGMNVERLELQNVRRLRQSPQVSMISLRVEGSCEGSALPRVLASLRQSQRLTVVDRYETTMANEGDRRNWTVRMILSTAAISEPQANQGAVTP
ncbi:MAG: hypothetical protein IT445_14075 [Phycisphaeraceae bacterium]|nr:hypothetical protein [Phycisphaeraceae bacterium]